ncbi:MAG: Putative transcriptional regulatory protein, partial [uncultured Thermomicrobiales bacterium]
GGSAVRRGALGGVRRAHDGRLERGRDRADDEHRPPGRPLRCDGGPPPGHEPRDRRGGRAQRALRPGVARGDGHRPGGGPRPGRRDLRAPGRARGLADASGRHQQPVAAGAVRPPAGAGRGPDRRVLPERGRRAVRRVPPLPAADGRGERGRPRRRAGRRDPAAGAGPAGAPRDRHRRCRRRLRERARHQPDGPCLPAQPLRRLRLLGRGRPGGARGGDALGAGQRPVRGARRNRPRGPGAVRLGHRLRRDPRPDPPRARPGRHRGGVAAGRRLPDGGHRSLQPRPREHGVPAGPVPVHHLVHALHDGLARPRRGGAGRDVGRADGPRDAGRCRLRLRRGQADRGRPRQHLLRRHQGL